MHLRGLNPTVIFGGAGECEGDFDPLEGYCDPYNKSFTIFTACFVGGFHEDFVKGEENTRQEKQDEKA